MVARIYGQLIEDKDLEQRSIYHILENDYSIRITKGCQRFDAAIADEELARFLDVAEGSPLLLIRRNSYTIGKNWSIIKNAIYEQPICL